MMKALFQSESLTPFLTRITLPGDVYAFLILGSDRALLVDTGFGYGDLKSYVDTLTDLPYEVVLTHGHLDHAPGAGPFSRVYMNRRDLEIYALHADPEVRLNGMRSPYSQSDPPDPALLQAAPAGDFFLPLEEHPLFDLGGLTVRAVPLPGHTPGGTVLLLEEPRILIAGDMLCSMTLLTLPCCLSVEEYLESLRAFRDSWSGTFDQIYYSHPHNRGGTEILDEMIRLCEDILAGKDDQLASAMGPGPGRLARRMGRDLRPEDGTSANLIYLPEQLRKAP
ncbi:MAG: MBL fold metallo-hydrolase [Oscillospiraceae bacterium]|nr:MBL fold metallo-hydrolase [Oscillospiraceae bacterium]